MEAIKQFCIELFQCTILAMLVFGPFFYYILFMMKE